jgi:hypothetical protein
MGRSLEGTAAFGALWRALVAARRDGAGLGTTR